MPKTIFSKIFKEKTEKLQSFFQEAAPAATEIAKFFLLTRMRGFLQRTIGL